MKWYKNIWFWVACALFAAGLYSFITARRQQQQYVHWQQQAQDSIKYYRDKQGTTHATIQVQQIPKAIYKHIADSIVQSVARGTKAKDLVQHSTINTSTTHRDTIPVYDTIIVAVDGTEATGKVFNIDDGALNLTGLLYDGKADVNYTFNMHLGHTTKWHRPGLFKKKQLIVDAYSYTPNTTITGMQSFVIQQPPKKWYETRAFTFGLGVVGGMIIHNQIAK